MMVGAGPGSKSDRTVTEKSAWGRKQASVSELGYSWELGFALHSKS